MLMEETLTKIVHKWGKIIKISFHNASFKEIVIKMSVTQKKKIEEVTIISDGKNRFEVCVQEVCPCLIHHSPSSELIDSMDEEDRDDTQSTMNNYDEMRKSDDELPFEYAHIQTERNGALVNVEEIEKNPQGKEGIHTMHN